MLLFIVLLTLWWSRASGLISSKLDQCHGIYFTDNLLLVLVEETVISLLRASGFTELNADELFTLVHSSCGSEM